MIKNVSNDVRLHKKVL